MELTTHLDRAVLAAADEVAALLGPGPADEARAAAAALTAAPRVAVVGRVNAGKSTLVNALVGRAVAPTAASECTRVVTWYRFGSPDRAELVLKDGTRRHLPLVDRRLPDELGVEPDRVRRLEVHLQAGALRHLTLIDTPGLASLAHDAGTTRASVLGSVAAAADADALLFLFRGTGHADEAGFLDEFREAGSRFAGRGLNALGVLARADETPGDEPLAAAQRAADELARARRGEVGTVVPVAALLASAVRAGRVDDAFARAVAALADADPVRLRLADRLGPPAGVDPDALARIQSTLGAYATLAGRQHAADAATLMEWLDDRSGVRRLEAEIGARLLPPVRVLRAARAIDALAEVAARAGSADAGAVVERLRLSPVTQPVRELAALESLRVDDAGSEVVGLLERLVAHDDAAGKLGLPPDAPAGAVAAAAQRLAERAQGVASLSFSPAEAAAALVVVRSARLITDWARSYADRGEVGDGLGR